MYNFKVSLQEVNFSDLKAGDVLVYIGEGKYPNLTCLKTYVVNSQDNTLYILNDLGASIFLEYTYSMFRLFVVENEEEAIIKEEVISEFKSGDLIVCRTSDFWFTTEGTTYKVESDHKGDLYITDDDGDVYCLKGNEDNFTLYDKEEINGKNINNEYVIKSGDVVQLKSGGSKMVVECIEGEECYCVWELHDFTIKRDTFTICSLMKV